MVAMEIIVVGLMVCRAVTVIIMENSTVLLTTVSFGVLQRVMQVMLGIGFCTLIVRE
jgi:hypothetical protein